MHVRHCTTAALAAAVAFVAAPALAGSDVEEIRNELKLLRQDYEMRIRSLEQRLDDALARAERAERSAAARADAPGAYVAPASPAPTRSAEAAFNPGISLILQGRYADLSQDPDSYRIGGFIPSGGEVGPGERGFSLMESELDISASVDPYFRGFFAAALTPEDEVEVEEAYLQTLALGHGLTLKGGRFFSGIGYLNELHQHAWDFIDPPLPYRAFLGRQLGDDGVQVKWVAPTDLFVEVGAEAGRGRAFPDSDRNRNGAGLVSAFAHLGGDAGANANWRAGLSYVRTKPQDRAYEDEDSTATLVTNSISGTSRLWVADLVWKWAPGGDASRGGLKLQAEYFRRDEEGTLTYDAGGASLGTSTDFYSSKQSGWYAEAIWQFAPRWRAGVRHDRLDGGDVAIGQVLNGTLSAADFPVLAPHDPSLTTAMVDWSLTEFSRLRLQYGRDKSRPGVIDDQVFLQYILSLGAHGAHRY